MESLLAIRIRGEVVGEMSALSARPRSASVITCSETAARVIRAVELNTFLSHHPVAAIELARMISERLRWANERRVDFAALSARARICRVLAELMATYGRSTPDGWELGSPLTQAEVASLAGVRLPTAEKVLRSLREQGVVLLRYRRIVVTDLDALTRPAIH